MASPERIVTLTDGVVAIAMTLLVLDLSSIDYQGSSAAALWRTLGQESGRFFAFGIAFWVTAQFWSVHHRLFRTVSRYDDSLAVRNFVFLFGISLLPFTTKLLGQVSDDNPLPVSLFSANLLLISVALGSLSKWIERHDAVRAVGRADRERLVARARRGTLAALTVLPGAVAWLIQPGTAELLFLLLFFADVPGQLLARARDRRSATTP